MSGIAERNFLIWPGCAGGAARTDAPCRCLYDRPPVLMPQCPTTVATWLRKRREFSGAPAFHVLTGGIRRPGRVRNPQAVCCQSLLAHRRMQLVRGADGCRVRNKSSNRNVGRVRVLLAYKLRPLLSDMETLFVRTAAESHN